MIKFVHCKKFSSFQMNWIEILISVCSFIISAELLSLRVMNDRKGVFIYNYTSKLFMGSTRNSVRISTKELDVGPFYNAAVLPLTVDTSLYIFAFGGGHVPTYCISSNSKCSPKKLEVPDIDDYSVLNSALRGFEDTRAMYTPSGDIVLAISCPSVNIERSTCLISAQVIIPELHQLNISTMPPVFPKMIELQFDDDLDHGWLKNQIPLFDPVKGLHVIHKAHPNIILSANNSTGIVKIKENAVDECTDRLFRLFRGSDGIHMGSNALRVVLCKQGECLPSIHNTVYMTLIHMHYGRADMYNDISYYFRLFEARNTTYPYKPVFFTKPFYFSEYDPLVLIYSETINFIYDQELINRDMGHLDTPVALGGSLDNDSERQPLKAFFKFEDLIEIYLDCK